MKKKNEEVKAQEIAAEETKLNVEIEDDSLTDAEPKQHRNIPSEQKKLNELMRTLRHVAFRFVRSIAGTDASEAQMTKLEESFKKLYVEIDKMQNEGFIIARFSLMSDAEKDILRDLLNK